MHDLETSQLIDTSTLCSMKHHLEPLALAANASQASHIRPDEIFIILAKLYRTFLDNNEPGDEGMRAAMLAAIEARWAKADQDVFIASVILNPFYKTRPFQLIGETTAGGASALFERLWKRFFAEDPPAALWENTLQYLSNRESFARALPPQGS